jgi:hypothetical protein
MKKFFCFVCALGVALAAIGCGGEKKKEPAKDKPATEKPADKPAEK